MRAAERRGKRSPLRSNAAISAGRTAQDAYHLPTVSLGSAAFSGEDVVAVKDRADRALYCAKKEQKARAAAEKHIDDSERTA